MIDVIVIGAGLFGSVIARHLTALGYSVLVIDNKEPTAGSRAAGCVIKPSWLTNFGGSLDPCMDLLKLYYQVHTVEFTIHPSGFKTTCGRIEPGDILGGPHINDHISDVRQYPDRVVASGSVGDYTAKRIVVAAGIWSPELYSCDVSAKLGWSFRGSPIPNPVIDTWAPYRQVVAFNMSDGRSWIGDGTALIPKSITPERLAVSQARCSAKSGATDLQPTLGARPYAVTTAPCLVAENGRAILATGGAKSGTVGAAYAALRVAAILRGK
jgi:glycine/D-amino acid oxidase-like deaminating enzyme